MAVLQDININVHGQPSEKRLQTFLRLSQNENGRMINFRVLGPPLPSNCTATFSGTKPDGNVYSKTGTVAGNFVIIQEDMQMTAVAGVWDAKLDIINGSHNIMTALIRVVIDADVVDPDAIASDSQLQGLVAEAKYYAEHARTDAYGSPLTAPTKAQMTDHTRVYVYTGSEPNMVAGNWYHWNGSAWTSGGVYNAVAVQTDKTLTVQDKAADGKATGDALDALKEDLSEVEDFSVPIDSGISVGTLTTGGYIKPGNGENGALAYGCRSTYIDIILGASPTRVLPLMLVASFDRTVYKYTVYGYGSHSVSSAAESFTDEKWTTEEKVLIKPSAGSKCIRFSAIRIDGQGSITAEQAADIASKVKFMRVTDATLTKDGIPADAYATGAAIAALDAKAFPNSAKKFAFFGDSFTWGRDGNSSSAQAQVAKPIPAVVAERLGVVADNYGVGGMGWVQIADHAGHPETNAYGMISSTDLSDYDYIVMDFGVNDGYKPIGEWNSVDEATVAGQVNKCVTYLKTTYPTIIPIVVAPWNGRNVGSYPDYWYGDVTGLTLNGGMRYSRQELRNVEARICQNAWIAFVDVYDSPINGASITEALPDGTHASADYYIKIGEWLAGKIGGLIR